MPAPEPALAGFTVESTAPDNGAITIPWPKPKIVVTSASSNAAGDSMAADVSASAARPAIWIVHPSMSTNVPRCLARAALLREATTKASAAGTNTMPA